MDAVEQELADAKIHKREAIEVVELDRELIAGLVARIDRRMKLGISVTEAHLYVTIGDDTIEGALLRRSL